MKNKYPLFVITMAVFMMFSFSSAPVKEKISSYSESFPTVDLNPWLYVLYIDNRRQSVPNPPKTNFQKLINSIDVATKDTKLVFQFFYSNDTLRLSAISGKKKHDKEFNTKLEIQLLPFNECQPTEFINGKTVYLGDLEISFEDDELANLKDAANDASNKFIIFVPKLVTDVNGRTAILYRIYATDILTQAKVCAFPLSLLTPIAVTNPSPPRKGN